jgi:uracil-DNA glycosylase
MNDELTRQVRTRLAGLAAAGVEWLPRVDAPVLVPAVPAAEATTEPPAPPDDLARRRHELTLLADRVRGCTRCPELAATRTQTVFGVGPVGAEIVFVGEAPGADEDRQGEPFVGAAGQMLNRIIAACGLRREDIFICNILRCRPPGNRQPKPEEAANCREYLDGSIARVRPKVICCWGAVAAQNLLQTKVGITKLRGRFYEYQGVPVLCTFHPAALLEGRSPEKKKEVWEDMKMLLARLGKPIPGTKKA